MNEIVTRLKLLVTNNGKFQNSNASSQKKMKVMKAVNNVLDFAVKETSPERINELYIEELQKINLSKLK